MPNRFNPGCLCCETDCIVFTDDFSSDPIGDEWTQVSGTWEPKINESGINSLYTEDDDAIIVAFDGGSSPRQWFGRIATSEGLAEAGVIVSYLDVDNYIYVQFTMYDPGPPLVSTMYIKVFEIIGGVETQAGPTFSYGTASLTIPITIATIDAKNGFLPAVQFRAIGAASVYQQVCVSSLPGSGFGYRTDNLQSGEFRGQHETTLVTPNEFMVQRNLRSNRTSQRALVDLDPPEDPTDCEGIAQCQNCLESTPPKELDIDITGIAGGGDCGYVNVNIIVKYDDEVVQQTMDGWKTTCAWFAATVVSVPPSGFPATTLMDVQVGVSLRGWVTDGTQTPYQEFELEVFIQFGRGAPFDSITATKTLTTDHPEMWGFDETITSADSITTTSACDVSSASVQVQTVALTSCP